MIANNPLTRALKKIYLRLKNRNLRHIVSKFADKSGLVYFGYVNQNSDDHKVVRGLTVSSSHHDNHYCVGSVGGYNVTLVDRSDYVWQSNTSSKLHNWFIVSIDLQTKQPIPHFFVGAKNHDLNPFNALFSTFPNMKELELGIFEKYDSEFTSRFSIYGRPAKSNDIQHIVTAEIAKILGVHFWPFSAEQHDNVLYLYSTNQRITSSLLETMLENGLWLASHLDSQAETALNQD